MDLEALQSRNKVLKLPILELEKKKRSAEV